MTDLPMLPCQLRILDFIAGAAIPGNSIARDIALVEKITAKGDAFWPPRLEAARIKLLVGPEPKPGLQEDCERVLALANGTLSEDVPVLYLFNAIESVAGRARGTFWEVKVAKAELALDERRREERRIEEEERRAEERIREEQLVEAVADERERVSDFVSEKPEVTPANLAADICALEAVQWFDPVVAAVVASAKRLIRERKEALERAERDASLERDRRRCTPMVQRLMKFVEGTLPSTVATSTIATDLAEVRRCYGSESGFRQLIADAEQRLSKRRAADEAALDEVRRQARDRYQRNRRNRASENRERAKEGGSARKQKQ